MRSSGFWLIVGALFVLSRVDAELQKDAAINTPSATVVFLDGSSQDVEDLRFVYVWTYTKGPLRYRTVSTDLHFKEVVRGVELDRTHSSPSIASLDLSWPKQASGFFVPSDVTIHLRDGKKAALGMSSFGATSAFLTNKSVDSGIEDVRLQQLNLEGSATIEDRRGRFSARLWTYGGTTLNSNEVVTKIVFRSAEDSPRKAGDAEAKATPTGTPKNSGTVTFFDGSKQHVDDIKFVYTWVYQGDMVYINYQTRKTVSGDFHYQDVIRGTEIDRVIAGRTLDKVELLWPGKPDGAGITPPEALLVTLTDATKVTVSKGDAAASFLTGNSVEQLMSFAVNPRPHLVDTNLRQIDVEGIATVEGQQGKFSASVWWTSYVMHSDPKLKAAARNKSIKEIVFARR